MPRRFRFRTISLMTLWAAASLACSATNSIFPPPGPTMPAPVQWRKTLAQGTQLVSPPALDDGLLVYLENAKDVVARAAASGAEKWRHALQKTNIVLRPLAVTGGLVFVDESAVDSTGAAHAHVLALDLHTGQVSWDQMFTAGPTGTLRHWTPSRWWRTARCITSMGLS